MQKQIEDLRRKAEQGSQQLQGEVQELELESLLRSKFPLDSIEPVPKGEFGGDVLQRVLGVSASIAARFCGNPSGPKTGATAGSPSSVTISGRQGRTGALISSAAEGRDASIMSTASGSPIALRDPVAIALRQSLIEIAAARQAAKASRPRWNGLPVPDRPALPPPHRGDRREVRRHAGGPRQGAQG